MIVRRRIKRKEAPVNTCLSITPGGFTSVRSSSSIYNFTTLSMHLTLDCHVNVLSHFQTRKLEQSAYTTLSNYSSLNLCKFYSNILTASSENKIPTGICKYLPKLAPKCKVGFEKKEEKKRHCSHEDPHILALLLITNF